MLNCVSFCKGSTAPSRLRPAQVARFPWTRRQPPALCGGFPKRSRPHTHVWRREKGSGTSSLAHTTPHHSTTTTTTPSLLTTCGLGRCCPIRLAGARLSSRRDGASPGQRAPRSAVAGAGSAAPMPGRGCFTLRAPGPAEKVREEIRKRHQKGRKDL